MTHALPSTVEPDGKFETRAAIGGPVGLWSQARTHWGHLSWVLTGKLALIGANAAVMLFLVNHLALETYGLLVITISGQLLISRLLLMGVDTGMVRLTAVPDLRSHWQEVVNAGVVSMACTSSVLLAVWISMIPVLSLWAIPGWVVACIVAGAIGTSLVDYGYSFRLARQEYQLAALAQGGTAVGRVSLTMLAAMKFPANPVAVFVAYHGASLLSGLAQTFFVARFDRLPRRELIKRLLSYSFWLGKANVIVIFSLYQGTLLLLVLKQPEATGLFGLALTLSLGFFAIYNAYSEYLLVRIRSVEHVDDVGRFIGRALAAALILMLACVPVIFAVVMLMPWFVAPELLVVVPTFVYLSASMVLLILQAPLAAACHYLLKPHLITLAWVMRVVLIAAAGLILAPRMGAAGAAVGQLIGSVLALLVLSWLVAGAMRSTRAKHA